ncbi:MAG: UDP-N-acetylmuramoyl-L-alanine--D-glutamate ligase [Pseudomonadota bacterium]
MKQSFLILGRGATGQAIADLFAKRNIQHTVIDDTKNPPFIDWVQYTHVVKSPGVSLHDPVIQQALAHNLQIWGDLAFFENPHKATVIGVTGTNGKSTVCAMIDHMLAAAGAPHTLGGNFGTPVMNLPTMPKNGCTILELSSYQLETVPASPVDFDIGILLNIDEDHLEHHKTMQVYAAAKEELLKMSKQTIIVTNDPWTKVIAKNYSGPTLSLEKSQSYWLKDNQLFYQNDFQAELPIKTGQHDVMNAAVTWIVGCMLNIDETTILASLASYKPLPHRQAFVRRIGQVEFINDSKATNIHAVIPSLQRFKGRPIYLILGGVPKFENLDALLPYMKDVACVYGIGEASNLIGNCLIKDDTKIKFKPCQTMDTALKTICQDLALDKPAVVLLAPACSSFDQYKNYEDRGDRFTFLVEALKLEFL